ncbi:hypothetical protein P154DRAFT_456854 [Amniculicola lignicola CBS 123094]|uniref:Uncharacterized protein n=1 Tax=Amniculicola lignicola CBS 123094 TaxID=1392246 RepID=A0A6A5X2P8_9PLEO|nr:hypothetical protein P154DRAFT_456854 [Amniculicola lignicola CBS 123094]
MSRLSTKAEDESMSGRYDDKGDSVGSTATQADTTKSTNLHALRKVYNFGWWWEVGAASLSLISTVLAVAILAIMKDRPLSEWHLPLQISSSIAVLSTFSRSALLLVLAEGLSQLKWNTFEKKSLSLNQLQVFDDASRGPWGAFVFFFKSRKTFRAVPTTSAVAATGAFLTVIGLAFEPFTQQIIAFELRRMPLTNSTAYATAAVALQTPFMSRGPKQTLMQGIMTLVTDRGAQLNNHFICPSGDCVIPEHWSLATQSMCDDAVTWNDTQMNCTYSFSCFDASNYSHVAANLQNYKDEILKHRGHEGFKDVYQSSTAHCLNVKSEEPEATTWMFAAGTPYQVSWQVVNGDDYGPEYWSRNDRKFWVTPSWGSFDPDKSWREAWPDGKGGTPDTSDWETFILGVKGLVEQSNFPPIKEVDTLDSWEGVKISKQQCGLGFIAVQTEETYLVREDLYTATSTAPVNLTCSLFHPGNGPCNTLRALASKDDIDFTFWIDYGTRVAVTDFLYEVANDALRMPFVQDYLIDSTVPDIAQMLGTATNSLFRSSNNKNSTKVVGTAYGKETYVNVRWKWGILPLFITTTSIAFLVFTICNTRRTDQLYKGSVLPGYLDYLEHIDANDVKRAGGYWNTAYGLEKRAQSIEVKLWNNKEGKIRFRRALPIEET